MPIILHLMDRAETLDAQARADLLGPVEQGIAAFEARTSRVDADLAVVPTSIYTDAHWYHSGKAFGPGFAQIEVNPAHPRYLTSWTQDAPNTVVHELHHVLRWPHVGPDWTLAEVAVLEGLAILAETAAGVPSDHWGGDPDCLPDLVARFHAQRDQTEDETTGWFRAWTHEGVRLSVPANYLIGRALMREALARLSLDPFEAATLPAAKLLAR